MQVGPGQTGSERGEDSEDRNRDPKVKHLSQDARRRCLSHLVDHRPMCACVLGFKSCYFFCFFLPTYGLQ